MNRSFEQNMKTYAKVIVYHGLNLQEGQVLGISGEIVHRDLAVMIAEEAYKKGAKFVEIELSDPRLSRLRILHSKPEDLGFLPEYIRVKAREIVDNNNANLYICGMEDPLILEGLDPKALNIVNKARFERWKYFYNIGIDKSKVHWCIVAGATRAWAQKILPHMNPEEAYKCLWAEIFKITRSDREDALEALNCHNQILHHRAAKLNDHNIRSLHFLGEGTDLVVTLSEHARFIGGSTVSSRGVYFEPNIPSEEVFTTPDYRGTNGYVTIVRPFLVNGNLIKGLRIEFKDGNIKSFSCLEGADVFKEYINSDEGACRLGEVALVGIDSPVYKSGIVFEEILFDENAACHIAVGSAYGFCINGNDSMSDDQLSKIGFNKSGVHTDMMISDETTTVVATDSKGKNICLIQKGKWQI